MADTGFSAGATVYWRGQNVPLEVLDAAGCRLARLDADPARPGPEADAYAEGGGHPLLRALAAAVLTHANAGRRCVIGSFPAAHVALFHFFQSLATQTPPVLVQLMHQPNPSAADFNRRALAHFAARCGVAAPALAAAITRRNRLRARLAALDARRSAAIATLRGSTMRALLDAYGTAAEHDAPPNDAPPPPDATRALLIGSYHPLAFYRALETQSFHIVAEASELGLPPWGPHVEETGDPLAALAAAYGLPAPSLAARADALAAQARASRAAVAIFALPAYEHATAWAYPTLRDALAAIGIPSIVAPPACFRDPEQAAAALASSRTQAA